VNTEEIAKDLEVRANRLSQENNPRNLGINEIVFSVAQFVRVVGQAEESADNYSRRIIWLTWVLVVMGILTIVVPLFKG
jgi:hypothetical protein